jgi:hypothetical protein
LAALVIANTFAARRGSPFLDLIWVKGRPEAAPLYEKWNSFSRITVLGDPDIPVSPISEGTSPTYPTNAAVHALPLMIDAAAETTLTSFAGDFSTVDYLKYDVKEIVHYLRQNSKVFIIGAGGGRDVLAALAMGQKSIRAVEMNQEVLATVNGRFGDFTGHLDRNPRVTFVNDEARSYLARSNSTSFRPLSLTRGRRPPRAHFLSLKMGCTPSRRGSYSCHDSRPAGWFPSLDGSLRAGRKKPTG